MKNATGRRLPALTNLLALEATVRLSSVTDAAKELCVTQSAISKQLTELEDFLGVCLLSRRKGAVAATPAGAQYLIRVRKAITELEDATLEVSTGQGIGGRLNLSVPVTLGNTWLLPKLLQFAKQHPHLQTNLSTKVGPVDLRASGLDAAIMFCDGPGEGQYGFKVLPLKTFPVCAPELVQAGESLASTLARLPLLHQATGLEAWPSFFELTGLEAPRVLKGPRYALLTMGLQSALSGLGVALMPDFVAGEDIKSGRLVRLSETAYIARKAYYFVCHQESVKTPAIALLVDWLKAQIP